MCFPIHSPQDIVLQGEVHFFKQSSASTYAQSLYQDYNSLLLIRESSCSRQEYPRGVRHASQLKRSHRHFNREYFLALRSVRRPETCAQRHRIIPTNTSRNEDGRTAHTTSWTIGSRWRCTTRHKHEFRRRSVPERTEGAHPCESRH